jgi:hypothetical protein
MNRDFHKSYAEAIDELLKPFRSVDGWMSCKISEEDQKDYPNAKRAAEIKSCPLYKALE